MQKSGGVYPVVSSALLDTFGFKWGGFRHRRDTFRALNRRHLQFQSFILSAGEPMKNLKSVLSAFAFLMAGVAGHANAATEKTICGTVVCFQLTPLAENVLSPAPQEQWLGGQNQEI